MCVYQLKKGKEYIIQNGDGKIYKGIFVCILTSSIVAMKIEGKEIYFRHYDTFYDLEEIKENGKKARQVMEKRSLDIILKSLLNENFEW